MGRGDYIDGRFVGVRGTPDAVLVSQSPRALGQVLDRFAVVTGHVNDAVAAARGALAGWRGRPAADRHGLLRALQRELSAREDAFAQVLCEEVGKPLWEARTEVRAAVAKIDVTLDESLSLVRPVEVDGSRARYAFRPHGVAAVLGPFNFPLHLVHGHVVPALALGNTVVVKPSELTPVVGALYAAALDAAGFPPGVFNLVQGAGDVGAALCAHPDVDAVMFTGSYAAGQAIRRATFEQPGKLLALEMGGRNPALVLDDANLDKAVHDVLWGAFVTAGQRCSGTAAALVTEGIFDRFRDRLLERAAALCVGDPLADGTFMGPLISAEARERYEARLAQALEGGAEPWLASARPAIEPEGAYVTPSIFGVERAGAPAALAPYLHEELFGPNLAVERVVDLDEALERANDSRYGLSASVFCGTAAQFEHALERLRYGCVNWNAPTCGASSRLPFGGLKQSGNHRPAALFSTLYSSYPVATLEGAAELDTTRLSPGLHWR